MTDWYKQLIKTKNSVIELVRIVERKVKIDNIESEVKDNKIKVFDKLNNFKKEYLISIK